MTYVPCTVTEWIGGDYRMAASIRGGIHTLENLAARIGASVESFVEDGLGPAKTFRAKSVTGRQIAFDYYPLGVEGPNLIILFESGRCSRSEVYEALDFFGVKLRDVCWFSPEMDDV